MCFLYMASNKSAREKSWRSRKRGTQQRERPAQAAGKACKLVGVTHARQARLLSARMRK
jgi:hypothetical protein